VNCVRVVPGLEVLSGNLPVGLICRSRVSRLRWRILFSSWPGKSAKRVFALDDQAIQVFLAAT